MQMTFHVQPKSRGGHAGKDILSIQDARDQIILGGIEAVFR
jgi:hypothetical protein